MDYSCRDIPMKLDINHQPLDFNIYLEQIIDIPKTSLDEPPYSFQAENDAIKKVESIITRVQEKSQKVLDAEYQRKSVENSSRYEDQDQVTKNNTIERLEGAIPPTCPIETPLTPMKGTLIPVKPCADNSERASDRPILNQVNLREFEDLHYNPFDHIELQTIDERRELDLVFRASYAGHSREAFFPQPTTTDCSTTKEGTDTITKS